jgi:SNF2 family DNA or RNA helicase
MIDPKRAGEPSAKIAQLIQHMQEVISEGHKVLVFSQFTSLLALVKKRLDVALSLLLLRKRVWNHWNAGRSKIFGEF